MDAGIVATGLLWSYAVGSFIAGRLGDTYGPRIMQTIGGIGTTILNIITSLQATLTGIFVTYTVNGFVQGQVYAPTNMLISQWYPKARRGLRRVSLEHRWGFLLSWPGPSPDIQ